MTLRTLLLNELAILLIWAKEFRFTKIEQEVTAELKRRKKSR